MAMNPATTGSIPPNDTGNTQPPQPKNYMRIENNTYLGAIQIMTGLVHIGLGALSIDIIIPNSPGPLVTIASYPYWGGVIPNFFPSFGQFIISGSLTVATTHCSWNADLLRMSLGFNLSSVLVAIIGICLYLFQLVVEGFDHYEYDAHKRMAKILSITLCTILICFSLLEICLALWAAIIEDFYHIPTPAAAPYTYGVTIVPPKNNAPA